MSSSLSKQTRIKPRKPFESFASFRKFRDQCGEALGKGSGASEIMEEKRVMFEEAMKGLTY